jgi:hypothetical protein
MSVSSTVAAVRSSIVDTGGFDLAFALIRARLYSLLKNTQFVSGHRFSDAVNGRNISAALAAAGPPVQLSLPL